MNDMTKELSTKELSTEKSITREFPTKKPSARRLSTKELTTIGMLCALAYVVVVVGRFPMVLFLKYDPKDVIIAIGGLIFGPLTSLCVTVIVSLVEMFTISDNGIIGFVMNVISSSSFACTAALIYKKKRKLSGAILGLLCGWACMAAVMMLWNYLITPLYMGYPREAVVQLLLPVFLPFNLIKGGLNAAITMLFYKPVVTVLRRSHLIEPEHTGGKTKMNIGVILAALLIIVSCVLLILVVNDVF